jgi:hypothetical protein
MEQILTALQEAGLDLDPIQDHREIYTEFIEVLNCQVGEAFVPTAFVPTAFAPLPPSLEYPAVEQLAFQLSLQLQVMEAHGFTLLFWQPSDIMQLYTKTQTIYLLANLSQIVPLHEKDPTQLVLVYPTVYPLPVDYCAPELLQMTALPFLTHRSASYYSLASMCLRLCHLSLAKLDGTKLFYFLERCLKAEPNERMLLYF